MRFAFIAGAVATTFVLGGCADNAYYQTRYMPTSSEESYSTGERLFWTEDAHIYDLPSHPPALAANEVGADDDHRQRQDCALPGPKFLSPRVAAGNRPEIRGQSTVDGLRVAVMREDDSNPRIPANPATRMGVMQQERELGAHDDRPQDPVSATDSRTRSVRGEGIDRRPVDKLSVMRDDEGWCPPKP